MTTTSKLLLGSFLAMLTASALSFSKKLSSIEYKTITASEDVVKTKAFEILTNKCNVCHEKRNRRRVFTKGNMDAWAQDIYKQVFVKKRMPKGKHIKLTTQEYQDVLTWISSTKNENHGNQH